MSSAFQPGLAGIPRWVWLFIGQLLAGWCVLVMGAGSVQAAPISAGESAGSSATAGNVTAGNAPSASATAGNAPLGGVPAGNVPADAVVGRDADAPAPMCDPDGASVAARDDIPEVDRGSFEAMPCEAQLLLASWRRDAPEFGCRAASCDESDPAPPSAPLLQRARYEAARDLCVSFPARAEPNWVPADVRAGLAASRGHARSLFRPPVARA